MSRFILIVGFFLAYHLPYAQSPYFPPATGDRWESLDPASLGWQEDQLDSLRQYLDQKNSKAFLILKDGKIAVEWYFDSFTPDSAWYWASAGKTLTAALTGIAQQEGYLSIGDTSSKYLGEGWTALTPEQEEKITLWNQLTMTSGMNGGLFNCILPSCLVHVADAGSRWAYHNAPYTLLRDVVEIATETDINVYTREKVLNKTGMTGLWVRTQSGDLFFSKARSMARFGWLMLNEGVWEGTPILEDTAYFRQMIRPSQDLNASYGYLWWLNGQPSHMLPVFRTVYEGPITPNAPMDMYAGLGKNGQFLNVIPSQNMVVVRMGESPDEEFVPVGFLNEMWENISRVLAGEATPVLGEIPPNTLRAFPNPTRDQLFLELSSGQIKSVRVYDLLGRILMKSSSPIISLEKFRPGLYRVEIENAEGSLGRKMIVKH